MTANLPPTRESRPLSTADLMDAIKLVAYRMYLLRRTNKGAPMTWVHTPLTGVELDQLIREVQEQLHIWYLTTPTETWVIHTMDMPEMQSLD